MTVNPAVNFITFIPTSRVVSWYTNSIPQVGTYTITITGKIIAASIFTQATTFSLQVYNCSTSTETIKITPSAAPATQSYTVGNTVAAVIVNLFSENSTACTSNDIVYTLSVTPSTSGNSTSFIVLQPIVVNGTTLA